MLELQRLLIAYRRTEKSMERVLGLNQSLVDSFTRQQSTPEPSAEELVVKADVASPSKLISGHNALSNIHYKCSTQCCMPLMELTCAAVIMNQ